jgi:hypothetical protein
MQPTIQTQYFNNKNPQHSLDQTARACCRCKHDHTTSQHFESTNLISSISLSSRRSLAALSLPYRTHVRARAHKRQHLTVADALKLCVVRSSYNCCSSFSYANKAIRNCAAALFSLASCDSSSSILYLKHSSSMNTNPPCINHLGIVVTLCRLRCRVA